MTNKEKIRFLGYDKVYDVIQIMLMQFNPKEEVLKRYVLNSGSVKEENRIDRLLSKFQINIDPKIDIFFDGTSKNSSFFSDYYTNIIKKEGFIDFPNFIERIQSDSDLKKKIITYYFDGNYEKEQDIMKKLCFDTELKLSVSQKEGLLRILLFWNEMVIILVRELLRIGTVLEQKYETHGTLAKKIIANMNEVLFVSEAFEEWCNEKSKIDVKISYVNPYILWRGNLKSEAIIILGVEYEKLLQTKKREFNSLVRFCHTIGDETRFQIMSMIKQKKGASITEIASSLGLPVKSVVYHVDKLKRMNVIQNQMEGKKAIYYINTESIFRAMEQLENFTKGNI